MIRSEERALGRRSLEGRKAADCSWKACGLRPRASSSEAGGKRRSSEVWGWLREGVVNSGSGSSPQWWDGAESCWEETVQGGAESCVECRLALGGEGGPGCTAPAWESLSVLVCGVKELEVL